MKIILWLLAILYGISLAGVVFSILWLLGAMLAFCEPPPQPQAWYIEQHHSVREVIYLPSTCPLRTLRAIQPYPISILFNK